MRATTAYIDIKKLRDNVRAIRKAVDGTAIMAIVKANAYGHGAIGVSRVLRSEGTEFLGVAFAKEGAALREAGDAGPIVVLIPSFPEEAYLFCKYDLRAAISSEEFLIALSREAKKRNYRAKVHLHIDTGMNRDGINAGKALAFYKKYGSLPNVEIEGISTHFATAASDLDFARKQLRIFNETLEKLKSEGARFKYAHASNSGAIINLPEARFNLVRPGLALYGYSCGGFGNSLNLSPILTLKSQVAVVRRIEPGESVGYDRLFVAERASNIATVPIGYGDGYFRNLTGKAKCLIGGKKYPIVGSICMDELMVDCGDDEIKPGDEAVLIGSMNGQSIWADELARQAGTITYEITSAISDRVPRVFVESDDGR